MNYEQALTHLKMQFTVSGKPHSRYDHTLGVVEMALALVEQHHLQLDKEAVKLAALLHDCAKFYPEAVLKQMLIEDNPQRFSELAMFSSVWHSFAGALVAKSEYHIHDEFILNAIRYHTTGRPAMSELEMIIFISDYIEPNRGGKCFAAARALAFQNLEQAVCLILCQTMDYLTEHHLPIYSLTQKTLEYYQRKEK